MNIFKKILLVVCVAIIAFVSGYFSHKQAVVGQVHVGSIIVDRDSGNYAFTGWEFDNTQVILPPYHPVEWSVVPINYGSADEATSTSGNAQIKDGQCIGDLCGSSYIQY